MKVSIYQPRYFPQLHYFNRIFSSHVFVFLESAQYTRTLVHIVNGERTRYPSYQSTTPIKTQQGRLLLGIPIKHTKYSPINKTQIAYSQQWITKHLNVIKNAYRKSPFFKEIFSQIEELLSFHFENLAELNKKTILWSIALLLECKLPVSKISEQNIRTYLKKANIHLQNIISDPAVGVVRPEGSRKGTEWTTAICQKLNATEFLYGGTAKSGYMEFDHYLQYGISPILQDWKCSVYPQQFSKNGFLANLSILDLFFNVSPKEAKNILNIF